MLFDYIAGGAGDEWTLARKPRRMVRVQLLPRMLRGVGRAIARDDGARHAGFVSRARAADGVSRPLPSRGGGSDGARATAAEGTIFCASTVSNRASRRSRAHRTARGGFSSTSIVTSRSRATSSSARRRPDTARSVSPSTRRSPGQRERDRRNSLRMPAHLELGELSGVAHRAPSSRQRQGLGARAVHRGAVGSGAHLGGRRMAALDLAAARGRERRSRAGGRACSRSSMARRR